MSSAAASEYVTFHCLFRERWEAAVLGARALGKIALQEKRGQVHGDLPHLPGGPKFFRQTCTCYAASEDRKESRQGWGG